MCCNRSKRHCCLQGTLVFLLFLCVLLFGAMVAIHLGAYFLTESSSFLEREQRHTAVNDLMLSSQTELNSVQQLRRRRDDINFNREGQKTFGDQLAEYLFHNCSINQWIVQSAMLLDLCPQSKQSPFESITNVQFKNCLRDSYWYIGLAAIVPFCLVLITLIAVCRLWLCPVITMAIVYLGLALTLVLAAILYKSGIILTEGWPLFVAIIALVCLYALLSLLLILLFGLVTCERRRRSKTNGTTDSDKIIMKMSDEDDEIDDPNVPLYHKNGLYSPQKRTDFDDKIKDFKYIDDDMSYVFRRG